MIFISFVKDKTTLSDQNFSTLRAPLKFHFIAICGVAMASVAAELKRAGFIVSGSDAGVYPPMSDFLAEQGIDIIPQFSSENIQDDAMIVIGNAVSRGNIELESALDRGLSIISLPELINRRYLQPRWRNDAISPRHPVVVAGTHGKTTTTTMTAKVFADAGKEPGWMIGGIPKDLPFPCDEGLGEHFIIEGDEYDAVYYDKRPKFMHYRPFHGIITSIEFDHADIYPDFEAVKHVFRQFVRLIPHAGSLTAWGDSDVVREISSATLCPVIFYGESGDCDWQLQYRGNILDNSLFDSEITSPDGSQWLLRLPLAGRHNALNALAAIVTAAEAGIAPEVAIESLLTLKGVARRLERLLTLQNSVGEVTVYDDFAHHPTAISESLGAIRGQYPTRRLVAIFEPRSNTMVRNHFSTDLTSALSIADVVILAPVHRANRIEQSERLDRELIAEALQAKGKKARVADTFADIVKLTAQIIQPGDVVVMMSNGSLGGIKNDIIQVVKATLD